MCSVCRDMKGENSLVLSDSPRRPAAKEEMVHLSSSPRLPLHSSVTQFFVPQILLSTDPRPLFFPKIPKGQKKSSTHQLDLIKMIVRSVLPKIERFRR